MEFASITFIWLFLPICLSLYYLGLLLTKKTAVLNFILLVMSGVFYAFGGIKETLFIVVYIFVNYIAGIALGKNHKKLPFILFLLLDILCLAVFKYHDMAYRLVEIINSCKYLNGHEILIAFLKFEGDGSIVFKNLIMPLALSFIVFQSISYVVDVYQDKVKAEKNIIDFYLYILLFVQLVQGPIIRYGDLGPQIKERQHSTDKFARGVERFGFGLAKKVIIANTVASKVNLIFNAKPNELSSLVLWFGVLLYTIQIYYDFSGYSDMAIGLGLMFGFDIPENFDYPYTSFSIQEFWRRWHISLSTWFKNYIYIPLGGNRRGKGRTLFNLCVVFFVTGIWHGVNLNFVVWGLFFALFNCIERVFLGDLLKKNPIKIINWIYTIFVVMIGWVFFRSANLYQALEYLKMMFVGNVGNPDLTILYFMNADVLIALILGILCSGLIQRPLSSLYEKIKDQNYFRYIKLALCVAVLVVSIALIMSGSYNPSIYGAF